MDSIFFEDSVFLAIEVVGVVFGDGVVVLVAIGFWDRFFMGIGDS